MEMVKIGIRFLLLLSSLLLAGTGCGQSLSNLQEIMSQGIPSSTGGDQGSESVRLKGTIAPAPSLSQTGLQGLTKRLDSEASLEGTQCQMFTLDGDDLGEFETDATGVYLHSVPSAKLKGSKKDEKGWSKALIVSCENGIELYKEVYYQEGEDMEIDLGEANLDTTVATHAIINEIDGFEGWGQDYSHDVNEEIDLTCLYEVSQAVWKNLLQGDGNLNPDHADFKQAMDSLMGDKFVQKEVKWENLVGEELYEKVISDDLDEQCMNPDETEDSKDDGTDDHHKISLCHIPSGNSSELHTIDVDDSAVQAHLAHGDYLGGCETKVNPEDASNWDDDSDADSDYDSDGHLPSVMNDKPINIPWDNDGDSDSDDPFDHDPVLDPYGSTPPYHDHKPPHIVHTPISGPVPTNEAVIIRATVTDDNGVASVTLTYWSTAHYNHVEVPMHLVYGSQYEAKIPSEFLIAIELEEVFYFIDAKDHEGNGPATGNIPGTASTPNRFTVQKDFSKLWSYAFGHVYGGFYRMIPGPSAAIGDVRSDLAGLEVATGNEEYFPFGYNSGYNSKVSGRWFLFESDGSVVFWKDTENDEAHSSVNLYDLNRDGQPEMLGGTTSGNQVQAFDGQGQWFWRYYLGGHSISTPAVDTLIPGETPKIFTGSFDGYIRSIDGKSGKQDWSLNTGQWFWSSAAVADLDGDSRKEVVMASDGKSYYYNYTSNYGTLEGVLYCLDAETGALNWKKDLHESIRSSAALADIDGDGISEVLLGDGSGDFKAFSGDTGELEWSFATGDEIVSSAAVGDLDGDGELETVFGSADGSVYALSGDGSLFWSQDLGAAIYSSPALSRRSHGSRLDVYVATMKGEIVILNGEDGSVISKTSMGYEIVSSPIVGDVDGDGKLEVFIQDRRGDFFGMQGDVFWAIRDEGSSVKPFAREWPVFRGNPEHTGVYGTP